MLSFSKRWNSFPGATFWSDFKRVGDAGVGEEDAAVGVEEDVRRGEVIVYYAAFMERLKGGELRMMS